jgi:hypothetical protein
MRPAALDDAEAVCDQLLKVRYQPKVKYLPSRCNRYSCRHPSTLTPHQRQTLNRSQRPDTSLLTFCLRGLERAHMEGEREHEGALAAAQRGSRDGWHPCQPHRLLHGRREQVGLAPGGQQVVVELEHALLAGRRERCIAHPPRGDAERLCEDEPMQRRGDHQLTVQQLCPASSHRRRQDALWWCMVVAQSGCS